jgi:prephenate dehydratase
MTAERVRVAFQGKLGADAEDAMQQLFGVRSEPVPCPTYAEAANAVVQCDADHVLLPVENTLMGGIGDAHDTIDRTAGLYATGETVVAVHHCVLAPHGASLDTIRSVLVHPDAIPQCSQFFRQHRRLETHPVFDTAEAAHDVAQLSDPTFATIGVRASAARYALDVIVADIDDRHDNQTRYLALSATPANAGAGTPVRTMLVFTTLDSPGALLQALQPFGEHGVNLRRLESRPTGDPWSYRFFVEFDHEVGNPHVDGALADIRARTAAARIVGTFPRWKPGRRGSIGWTPMDVPIIA